MRRGMKASLQHCAHPCRQFYIYREMPLQRGCRLSPSRKSALHSKEVCRTALFPLRTRELFPPHGIFRQQAPPPEKKRLSLAHAKHVIVCLYRDCLVCGISHHGIKRHKKRKGEIADIKRNKSVFKKYLRSEVIHPVAERGKGT